MVTHSVSLHFQGSSMDQVIQWMLLYRVFLYYCTEYFDHLFINIIYVLSMKDWLEARSSEIRGPWAWTVIWVYYNPLKQSTPIIAKIHGLKNQPYICLSKVKLLKLVLEIYELGLIIWKIDHIMGEVNSKGDPGALAQLSPPQWHKQHESIQNRESILFSDILSLSSILYCKCNWIVVSLYIALSCDCINAILIFWLKF